MAENKAALMKDATVERRARSARRTATGLGVAVIGLNAVAWTLLLVAFVPAMERVENGAVAFALGVGAFALGVRHGFDADHIAAIDNVTRRLASLDRPSASVGWWFALGHSTVVLAASLLVGAGLGALIGEGEDASGFARFTSVWGPAFSGIFLLLLSLMNAAVLVRMSRGSEGGGTAAAPRGILARATARPMLRRPGQMYAVGLLFGLGFDTATSVSLIVAASVGVAQGLPLVAVAALPLLFAGGMVLVDTVDGALMSHAYRWAQGDPGRRRRYDLLVTGTTVVIGGLVATVQLATAIGAATGSDAGPFLLLERVDSSAVGAAMIIALAASAVVGVAVSRAPNRRGSPRRDGPRAHSPLPPATGSTAPDVNDDASDAR